MDDLTDALTTLCMRVEELTAAVNEMLAELGLHR